MAHHRWSALLEGRPLLAVAGVAAAAAVLTIAKTSLVNWCREPGYIVPHSSRSGVEVRHGQRLQLSPVEAALVKMSMFMKGALRMTHVIILSGPVDAAALDTAARIVSAAHGVLRCKIVCTSEGPLTLSSNFVLEVDDGLALPVTVQDTDGVPLETAWRNEWARLEKIPLQCGQPLARLDAVTAIEPSGVRTALLISCEHAFCDGMSLSTLTHELLQALCDLKGPGARALVPQAPLPELWGPSFESACAPSGRLAIFKRIFRRLRMRLFRGHSSKSRDTIAQSSPGSYTGLGAGAFHTFVQHGQLSPDYTQEMLSLCRRNGTTATGAVSSALMHAAAAVIAPSRSSSPSGVAESASPASASSDGSSPSTTSSSSSGSRNKHKDPVVHLACEADSRRLLDPPLSPHILGYHVSGVAGFEARINPVAQAVRRQIEASIASEYPLATAGVWGQYWESHLPASEANASTPTLLLSNWGVSPVLPTYKNTLTGDGFVVYTVIPVLNTSACPYPFVLVSTYAGCLNLVMLTATGVIDNDVAKRFFRETMAYLYVMLDRDQHLQQCAIESDNSDTW